MLSKNATSPTPSISFRPPLAIYKRLDSLAKVTGRKKSYYIAEAVMEHLDDLEDIYLIEQRVIESRAGRSRTYSLEEVMKMHNVEAD